MSQAVSEIVISSVECSVRELQPPDNERWSNFVARHADANLYHTLAWRDVIQDVFDHQAVYLMCERGADMCGVLPMFLVKFPMLGSKLISLPYDVGSGGALAEDDASERALVERSLEIAREMQVNYLELRYGSQRRALTNFGLHQSEPLLISEMELISEDQVWSGMKDDHRKAIRKAKKRGVTIREAESLEDFRKFYQVYLRVFRGFGTPPYSANYFTVLWQRLHPSRAVRLLLAYAGGHCLGGLLLFCWGKNLVSKFAVCLPEAVHLRVYVALYWQAIQLGLEQGYRKLSWGTSSREQGGLIEFKERWGAVSHPAVLYGLPIRGKIPSIEKYYSADGFERHTWRKLPLSLTRVGGGLLNRWFC